MSISLVYYAFPGQDSFSTKSNGVCRAATPVSSCETTVGGRHIPLAITDPAGREFIIPPNFPVINYTS